jgi:hypothetical protein
MKWRSVEAAENFPGGEAATREIRSSSEFLHTLKVALQYICASSYGVRHVQRHTLTSLTRRRLRKSLRLLSAQSKTQTQRRAMYAMREKCDVNQLLATLEVELHAFLHAARLAEVRALIQPLDV